MAEAVRLDSVVKRYGKMAAVDGLSLTIRSGTVAGLVGPNGCGKTTTLGLVTGLKFTDSGDVSVGDYDMSRSPLAAKSNIAFVPDDVAGFENLTVAEYLDFYRSLHKVARVTFDEKAGVILEAFELLGYARAALGELSHGTRRKVAITAAATVEKPVWIIDEPTVGLDPESVVILSRLIKHHRKTGNTTLLATQDLAFAERVCDLLFLMAKGRLLAQGSPEHLVSEYRAENIEEVFLTATGLGRRIDGLDQRLEVLSDQRSVSDPAR